MINNIRSYRILVLGLLFLVGIIGVILILINMQNVKLPYDNTNPILYDNDAVNDVYTDDYLMALASAGDINLVGMITSSSVAPFNPWVTSADYEMMVAQRAEGVRHARSSGFRNIPDPVRGPKGHLQEPDSGKIEDTQPIGSEGSWLVVNEAGKTTPDRPLVLVMGGTLTVAADAYLLDNSIADKVVVAWLGGNENDMNDGYNGLVDPWATYIVLQKLRLVLFHPWYTGKFGAPDVPKARLTELPDTELRQWMIDKQHPNGLPDERDADAPPAISLMRPDYYFKRTIFRDGGIQFKRHKVRRVSFSHWIDESIHKVPAFKEDPNGRALVIPIVKKDVATEEWWRALKNPAAYNGNISKQD